MFLFARDIVAITFCFAETEKYLFIKLSELPAS